MKNRKNHKESLEWAKRIVGQMPKSKNMQYKEIIEDTYDYTNTDWYVDCNQFGLMKYTDVIIRDISDDDNGVGNRIMIAGIHSDNDEYPRLKEKDAKLMSKSPKLLRHLISLRNQLVSNGIDVKDIDEIDNLIKSII